MVDIFHAIPLEIVETQILVKIIQLKTNFLLFIYIESSIIETQQLKIVQHVAMKLAVLRVVSKYHSPASFSKITTKIS